MEGYTWHGKVYPTIKESGFPVSMVRDWVFQQNVQGVGTSV